MGYTNDWEDLMNGVFGAGGKLRFTPGTPKPDETAAQTGGLPDLNAALLEQQKRLGEMLEQQNAALKQQDGAAQSALADSRRLLKDLEDDGLLARGTTEVKAEHLGSFEGLADAVKQSVLGQAAFVDSVVRAHAPSLCAGHRAARPPGT